MAECHGRLATLSDAIPSDNEVVPKQIKGPRHVYVSTTEVLTVDRNFIFVLD
jgi:hypothetical protein